MIEYFIETKNQNKLKKINSFQKGCWTHVSNPSEEELNVLSKEYKFDKNNLIDGLDIHENPRLDVKNKKIYLYLTIPTEKINQEHDSSFLIVLSKGSFFTFSMYSLEIFNHIIKTPTKIKIRSNSKHLLRFLYYIAKYFEVSVNKIMKDIKKNKADLNKLKNKDIARLIEYEDKLNNYISSFGITIQVYNKILKEKTIKLERNNEEALETIIIDLNETLNLCKQILKTISNMREYYTTKLSNELNKTVTILTIFTIFLSIPTLIASIYGMNISLPFQSSSFIFSVLCFLVLGIWILMYFILKSLKII